MCGIVGYVGHRQAAPLLLEGLSKLEYRGYDSAGIAVRDKDRPAVVVKAVGKLSQLSHKVDGGRTLPGCIGIGHTRWATHGEPNLTNAHPHLSTYSSECGAVSSDCLVVGVHNGIIENYQELKEKLLRHGYRFYSDTDTEVLIKLVDYYYRKYKVGPIDALAKTMVRVRGSYALEVMFSDYPEEIYVARKESPMIVGMGEGEFFVASDVPAVLKQTRDVYYLQNLEMARITSAKATFFNLDGDEVQKKHVHIEMECEAAEKGGYPHFMLKEIHEQPKVVEETLHAYVSGKEKEWKVAISSLGLTDDLVKSFSQVCFVACGSAWHVGMELQYVMEEFTDLPVRCEYASEFRYRKIKLEKHSLVVVISQSGETADSLAALRKAKEQKVKTLAVVNVVGSSIAREADFVMYTHAGPEISVATTKAYSCQLVCGFLLALEFGRIRGGMDDGYYTQALGELLSIPGKIAKILEDKERIQWFASKFANSKDIFFIGRGIDYAICLEGSLKMKEVSYIHSEAYAAGEMKHGTISLIENGTLVIGLLTQSDLYEKTQSNMVECKSRGAYLMGITEYGKYEVEDSVNFTVYIPKVDEHFVGSLAIIPLQLLAYYTSVAMGLDVDKPRNLAKSVTVE